MKLKQVLNEYDSSVPLQKWMSLQTDLWKKMVEKGEVEKNDTDKFMKFGRFFDKYYKQTHHFPGLKDVERVVL